MENIKKNPLSLQLNAEDFLPASNEEKQSLVVMRESVNFWKDGIRRLKKNKIAMVSFVFIIAIAIFAYLLPAVWPYSYSEQMKGSNNLKPFEYSASEQARIDAGEKVFPHILGTDRMGRDFAVRIMMGTRVSLSVGLIASVLVLIIGATYGAVAAFAGGPGAWGWGCRSVPSPYSAGRCDLPVRPFLFRFSVVTTLSDQSPFSSLLQKTDLTFGLPFVART